MFCNGVVSSSYGNYTHTIPAEDNLSDASHWQQLYPPLGDYSSFTPDIQPGQTRWVDDPQYCPQDPDPSTASTELQLLDPLPGCVDFRTLQPDYLSHFTDGSYEYGYSGVGSVPSISVTPVDSVDRAHGICQSKTSFPTDSDHPFDWSSQAPTFSSPTWPMCDLDYMLPPPASSSDALTTLPPFECCWGRCRAPIFDASVSGIQEHFRGWHTNVGDVLSVDGQVCRWGMCGQETPVHMLSEHIIAVHLFPCVYGWLKEDYEDRWRKGGSGMRRHMLLGQKGV